jgi:signal transduction histidine kinase
MICIAVKDNGIGIDADLVDKLFLLTENKNRKGTSGEPSTGLGLMLCKEFVEKQGGKLWAESVDGRGSVFYFTLKIRPD